MTDTNPNPTQDGDLDPPDPRLALAVLILPEGMTSVSWGGSTFKASKGRVRVPHDAVIDLIPHGLKPAE
jgi:hypothetical protein